MKRMRPPAIEFVCVEWEDANGNATSEYAPADIPGVHKASVFYSWGWLVLDNEIGVTLMTEWCPKEETWRGRMFMPRGMVRSVTPFPKGGKKNDRVRRVPQDAPQPEGA